MARQIIIIVALVYDLPVTVLTSTSSDPPRPRCLYAPWYTLLNAPSWSSFSSLTGTPRESNERIRSSKSSHIRRSLTAI